MAEYAARIEWRCSGDFASQKYSRSHSWSFDGGAVVPASASPRNVAGPYADAAAVDPEEALVAAVSSCHMLWFLWLAAKDRWDVAEYQDDARGALGKDERRKISIVRVTLNPVITFRSSAPGAEALKALHHAAHDNCFIANSLRGDVVVASFATRVV